MSRVYAALLSLLLILPAVASADAVREALQACMATADAAPAGAVQPEVDGDGKKPAAVPKNDRSGFACPQLRDSLQYSPYAAWLPRDWSNDRLTREQLVALERLLAGAQQQQAASAPDIRHVPSVLDGLQQAQASRDISAWERFVQWMKQRLQARKEEPPAWLVDWLERLKFSGGGAQAFTRFLFLLIVAGALLAIFNELRVAGMLRRSKDRQAVRPAGLTAALAGGPPGLEEIETAELRLQPSLLLRLLLATLARNQRVAADLSLTHRELKSAVQFSEEQRRAEFARLVGCAEQARYAGTEPDAAELTAAVVAGRSLIAGLAPQ